MPNVIKCSFCDNLAISGNKKINVCVEHLPSKWLKVNN